MKLNILMLISALLVLIAFLVMCAVQDIKMRRHDKEVKRMESERAAKAKRDLNASYKYSEKKEATDEWSDKAREAGGKAAIADAIAHNNNGVCFATSEQRGDSTAAQAAETDAGSAHNL